MAAEAAIRETSGELVALGELVRGADQGSGGVGDEGVSAVENSQRRKRIETGVKSADAHG
jgi:hypothetical protein